MIEFARGNAFSCLIQYTSKEFCLKTVLQENLSTLFSYLLENSESMIAPPLTSTSQLLTYIIILLQKILDKDTCTCTSKYLLDLISLHCSSSLRPLRSSTTLQLTLGPCTITRYGDRAFSVIAPILWNKLPVHIHNTHSLDQLKLFQ